MIEISKSKTADTRSCDFANVTVETLRASSAQHIDDVRAALFFFTQMIGLAATTHDLDKLTGIDWFHGDFVTGFKETGWWDNHRKITRHHLSEADGVREDVNLIDVLGRIARGGDERPEHSQHGGVVTYGAWAGCKPVASAQMVRFHPPPPPQHGPGNRE